MSCLVTMVVQMEVNLHVGTKIAFQCQGTLTNIEKKNEQKKPALIS